MRYAESIDMLPGMVGARNAALLKIVLRGISEGVPPETMAEDLRTKAGDPPLDEDEIQRALQRGKEMYTGRQGARWDGVAVAARKAEAALMEVSDEERYRVTTLIERGREYIRRTCDGRSCVFAGFSRVAVNPLARAYEDFDVCAYAAKLFVQTVFPDDAGFVFFTNALRAKRDRSHIMKPSELHGRIGEWAENVRRRGRCQPSPLRATEPCIPQFVCPNLHSGEPKKDSYANKETVIHRRVAVIEFDALPIEDQAAFWCGVLMEQPEEVLTITHSRGKSLHGLVSVEEPRGGGLFGDEPLPQAELEMAWKREWGKLRRNFCSHPDPAYRCDAACSDATRMTRFPGAMRWGGHGNGETLCHALVFCNAPNAERDVGPGGINWQEVIWR